MSSSLAVPHKNYVQRLYRQALRSAFDHYSWHHDIYRQHCLLIRSRFEQNRTETNPIRIEALVRDTEEELERNKHVRPFKKPTAIGGTKYNRNAVLSPWVIKHGEGNWTDYPVEYEKIQ